MLNDRTDKVSQMPYTITQPIDLVFNAVEDLADYAKLAHIPSMQRQTVNQAYLILLCSGHFKDAIHKWNCRPFNQQDWPAFLTFFCQAHQEIHKISDFTLDEAQRQQQQAHMITAWSSGSFCTSCRCVMSSCLK